MATLIIMSLVLVAELGFLFSLLVRIHNENKPEPAPKKIHVNPAIIFAQAMGRRQFALGLTKRAKFNGIDTIYDCGNEYKFICRKGFVTLHDDEGISCWCPSRPLNNENLSLIDNETIDAARRLMENGWK